MQALNLPRLSFHLLQLQYTLASTLIASRIGVVAVSMRLDLAPSCLPIPVPNFRVCSPKKPRVLGG